MIRAILIGGALILTGFAAHADDHEPENIHFNALISEGQEQQKGLDANFKKAANASDSDDVATVDPAKEAAAKPAEKDASKASNDADADKENVLDLVDAELTVKKSDVADKKPDHIAKRVFNSVGEPRVATLPEVELIQKRHSVQAIGK